MAKLLIYCTKAKPYLYSMNRVYDRKRLFDIVKGNKKIVEEKMNNLFCMNNLRKLNGKIVAECDFEVEEIYYLSFMNEKLRERIYKESCLSDEELSNYMNGHDTMYAIHIKNLNIFDKPKELSDYGIKDEKINDTTYFKVLEKAPQNMCYVMENAEKKVLISIHSEWLCKILNGEKTIECRKRILKEMI